MPHRGTHTKKTPLKKWKHNSTPHETNLGSPKEKLWSLIVCLWWLNEHFFEHSTKQLQPPGPESRANVLKSTKAGWSGSRKPLATCSNESCAQCRPFRQLARCNSHSAWVFFFTDLSNQSYLHGSLGAQKVVCWPKSRKNFHQNTPSTPWSQKIITRSLYGRRWWTKSLSLRCFNLCSYVMAALQSQMFDQNY